MRRVSASFIEEYAELGTSGEHSKRPGRLDEKRHFFQLQIYKYIKSKYKINKKTFYILMYRITNIHPLNNMYDIHSTSKFLIKCVKSHSL